MSRGHGTRQQAILDRRFDPESLEECMRRDVVFFIALLLAVGAASCGCTEQSSPRRSDKKPSVNKSAQAAEMIFIDRDKHILALEKLLGMARADLQRLLGKPDLTNKAGEKGKDRYLKAAIWVDYDETEKAITVSGHCDSPTTCCQSKVFGVGAGDLKKDCVRAWGEPATTQAPLFAGGPFSYESVLWRHDGCFIWVGIAVRDSDGTSHKALGNYKAGTVLHLSVSKGDKANASAPPAQ